MQSIRGVVRAVMTRVASGLNKVTRGQLSPHVITVVGVCMHVPIALLIASGDFITAGMLLIVFGLFDTLDGALARVQKSESRAGMLLDSVTDRIKEILLYVGIAYYFVSVYDPNVAIWAVAACGISLLVSYVNAWGEVVSSGVRTKEHQTNKKFRGGIMSFDVRMFTLVVGLLLNQVAITVIVITILAGYTVATRLIIVLRRLENVKN